MEYKVKRFSSEYRIVPQIYIQYLKLLKDNSIRRHYDNNVKGLFEIPSVLFPIPQEDIKDINSEIGLMTTYFKDINDVNTLSYIPKEDKWAVLNKDLELEEIIEDVDLKQFIINRIKLLKEQALGRLITDNFEDSKVISYWLDLLEDLIEKYL